jgi:hypothetical protein
VPTHRLFLLAPSLARLIEKERGGERVQEGYFPNQPGRNAFVQVDEIQGRLILQAGDETAEERADLPMAHAQALLAVSQGQVKYVRTKLSISSRELLILHFVKPGPLDLIMVSDVPEDGQDHPLPWFGPEVSAEPAYQHRRLAFDGAPNMSEIDVTNAALNSLLDALDDRAGEPQLTPARQAQAPAPSRPTFDPKSEQELDELHIEDSVIRELARSLQPKRR